MRVTRKHLQTKLDALNKHANTTYELNYVADYGGYAIETSSRRIADRMSARELYQWLNGALAVAWDRV